MRTITKFEPLSVMKMAGICYAALGLLEGLMFGLILSMKMFALPAANGSGRVLGPLFGLAMISVFPILLGGFGAIAGGLGAVIYNIVSKYVGGIAVEVE
jgi:hypothetical protein